MEPKILHLVFKASLKHTHEQLLRTFKVLICQSTPSWIKVRWWWWVAWERGKGTLYFHSHFQFSISQPHPHPQSQSQSLDNLCLIPMFDLSHFLYQGAGGGKEEKEVGQVENED